MLCTAHRSIFMCPDSIARGSRGPGSKPRACHSATLQRSAQAAAVGRKRRLRSAGLEVAGIWCQPRPQARRRRCRYPTLPPAAASPSPYLIALAQAP